MAWDQSGGTRTDNCFTIAELVAIARRAAARLGLEQDAAEDAAVEFAEREHLFRPDPEGAAAARVYRRAEWFLRDYARRERRRA